MKLLNFFRRIKKNNRLLRRISCIYKKSFPHICFYIVSNSKIDIITFRSFFYEKKRLLNVILISRKLDQHMHYSEGQGKYVVFKENHVIYLYKDKSMYENARYNYDTYSSSFNYNFAKITSFDDVRMLAIAEKIDGEIKYDSNSNDLIINYLLDYSKWRKIKIINGIASGL